MAALQRIALPAPRTFGRHISRRVLIALAVAIGVTIAAMQVNQLSRAASTGYAIDDLTRQRAAEQAANHELEAQVAQLSSLARVEWVARTQMGLVPPARTVFVSVHERVPDRQSLPLKYQAQPPAVTEAASQPWWARLFHALPAF